MGTYNSSIYPSTTGLNLGNASQRWTIYGQNMDVAGTVTFNNLNGIRFAGQSYSGGSTIQAAITDAGTTGTVIIPSTYTGSDSFTNASNILILDFRGQELTVYGEIKADKAVLQKAVTVSYSATPVFDASTANAFKISLSGNVTSSTLSNITSGQVVTFFITQTAGGNTFVWPTNVSGGLTPSTTAGVTTVQTFVVDGTTARAASVATTPATGLTGSGTAGTISRYTGVSSSYSISSIQRTSNVVTLTTSTTHNFTVGMTVTVAGVVTLPGFNGAAFTVSTAAPTQITYSQFGGDSILVSGEGTVSGSASSLVMGDSSITDTGGEANSSMLDKVINAARWPLNNNCTASGGSNPCLNAGERINQAVFDLPTGGGTVDLRGFGAATQLISAPVYVGCTAGVTACGNAEKAVTLLHDSSQVFKIQYTGTSVLTMYHSASIVGLGSQTGRIGQAFQLCGTGSASPCSGTAASVTSILTNHDHVNGTANLGISNTEFAGDTGSSATYIIDFQAVTDLTTVENVAISCVGGIGLHVTNGTGIAGSGPINFDNLTINGNGLAGSRPLVVEATNNGTMSGMNFDSCTIVHPGAGQYAVEVNGHNHASGQTISNVNFNGLYGETIANITSWMLLKDVQGVIIDGMTMGNAGGTVTNLVEIAETTTGNNRMIQVRNLADFMGATNSVKDTPASRNVPSDYVPYYQTNGNLDTNGVGQNYSYIPAMVLAPVTQLQLPATVTNGALIYCSNCSVSTPCAGAGSGAFAKGLNGIWDCA